MEIGKLTVDYRSNTGKNEARRLRKSGRVPGICYGAGAEPLPISLSARELKKALDPAKRQNTVIHVTVNADGGARELTVMLKDYQIDSLRRDVQHVDLVVIDLAKDVHVEVPVVLIGKAAGVIAGGQLHAVHRTMKVICKPSDIPIKIEVDVTPLEIGQAIHVRDLQLPSGVRADLAPGETIASVVAPKVEKVAAEGAAAPAEGAAAAPAAAAPAAKGGEAKAPAKEGAKK